MNGFPLTWVPFLLLLVVSISMPITKIFTLWVLSPSLPTLSFFLVLPLKAFGHVFHFYILIPVVIFNYISELSPMGSKYFNFKAYP